MSKSTDSSAKHTSEAFYQTLVESLPVGVLFADSNLVHLYVNEQASQMTGYSIDELMAGVWMVHPDDTKARALFEQALREGIAGSDYETRFVRKDGSVWWASVSWKPVRDEHGDIAGVCTVFVDISDSKNAEDELRRVEARYRELSEKVSDMIWEMGIDGRFTYISGSARHLGYEPEECIGRNLLEFLPPDEQAVFSERLSNLNREPGPAHYEVRALRKDGSEVWIEVISDLTTENGKSLGFHGVARDITRRKAAEEALQHVNERYRILAENASDMFWEMEADGRFSYVSQAVRKLGYEPEEWIGHRLVEFLAADEVPVFLERLRRDLQDPHPVLYEVRALCKDGSEIYMEVMVDFVVADGSPLKIHGVARDISRRKATEEELQQVNERYRIMAENASDIHWALDLDGVITYVSQAVRQIGYEPEDWIGHNAIEFMLPEEHAPFIKRMSVESIRNYRPTTHQLHVRRKDGSAVWLEVMRDIVRVDGVPVGVQGVARDITLRKIAEEALQESEQKFKSIVENSNDLIMLSAVDGTLLYASPASLNVTGYAPEEIIGTHYRPVHPDDDSACRPLLARAVAGERGLDHQYRILDKPGETRWISHAWSPIMADDKVQMIVSVVRDITERIRNQEALRESEERYKSIVENSNDLIMLTTPEGRIAYASAAAHEVTGYEPEELVAQSPWFIHPEDSERMQALFLQANQVGSRSRAEYRILTKTGETRWVAHSWSPILDGERLQTIVSVIRDITEAKQSEDALRTAHTELEQAYRLQQEFLNSVTHEVRTPLTAVKGYADMLMEGMAGPVSEEQAALLAKVLTSSGHLLDVVNGVLQIARLKSGKIALNPRMCDPRKVVDKAVSAILPQAEQKDLTVNVQSDPAGCLGIYDEEKLVIILTNLLSNAVKFTEAGSVNVLITCCASGARIVVADTGMGISSSDLPGIFDEFIQLDYPRKHKPSGFGIGLTIVATMVETIGASLTVSSKKGVGTAFTLCAPVLEV